MKKLLLIALVACGFAFVPVQHSDAQIYVGIPGVVGVGTGGYYGGIITVIRGAMGITHTVTTDIIHTGRTTIPAPHITGTTDIEFTIATIAITITTAPTKVT